MGSTPSFVSTPRLGVGAVSTANTARDGTGTIATVLTAVTAGTRIDRIVVIATGDPADSVVNIFLHDGSTAWFFDQFDMGNPNNPGTTTETWRGEKAYESLILPNGWSIRASITVALVSGQMNVFALGGDLT